MKKLTAIGKIILIANVVMAVAIFAAIYYVAYLDLIV